jgi:hypothetical protein
MAEGSFALNKIPLPVILTWERFRQSPSGHYGPTMSVRTSFLRGCKVESTMVGSDVVESEGEGPG